MRFDEKLIVLRRQRGMSQEQLAEYMGVTRQSVSKWESGIALPELSKIVSLSELFGVSVDYLVKENLVEEPLHAYKDNCTSDGTRSSQELETMVGEIHSYMRGYQYTSKTQIFGIPLVCIRLSRNSIGRKSVAKGIIAIGNIAVGVISIGLVSIGVFSIGCLALGILAFGAMAAGFAAFGAAALGILAFGSAAVGVYAGGVAVCGNQVAVGVAAWGETVVAESPHGVNELQYYEGITRDIVRQFLLEHHPSLWNPVLDFLSALGGVIK